MGLTDYACTLNMAIDLVDWSRSDFDTDPYKYWVRTLPIQINKVKDFFKPAYKYLSSVSDNLKIL